MEADLVTNGRKGLEQFGKAEYGAVILDLMLPGKNGFDICREIRKQSDVPILLVTARKEDIDKIKGLGLGADDYVVKPFSPVELVARVKAHIRIHKNLKTERQEPCIQAAGLTIYPDSYRVYKDGKAVELTGREFRLFQFDEPTAERRGGIHAGQLKSYIQLCLALSQMAKDVRTASPKPQQNENPKYAMRTWLLRLGFIGEEFATARDFLTRNLSGDTAFRHGRAAA